MKRRYSTEQLMNDFRRECREISEYCADQGFPSHGANYDLQCEMIWNNYYEQDFERAVRLERKDSYRIKSAVFKARQLRAQ